MKFHRQELCATALTVSCAAAILFGLVSSPSAKADNAEYRRLERQIEQVRDYQDIQNLMARRMWYHSAGENEKELDLWTKKQPQNARWEQNQGCWVGMKSINSYYNILNVEMQKADLKHLSEINPAIKNRWPENRGIGNNAIHTLTSPLIVIAGDGKSAKATWYTIGVILTSNDGHTPQGIWMWERYGADLVKESGKWRFLHIQVNTDFANPLGKPLQVQRGPAIGNEGGKASMPGPGAAGLKVPPPAIAGSEYRGFSATRVPTLVPRPPVPYYTLSKTFQYATCGLPSSSPRLHASTNRAAP